ncbi:NAD-dependent dehydratase [Pseudomonas taiwanensis]|uniref:UDP-glucose 4-epimerase family protein n=1 Tax=Pseudomonas taiwanensis TaxID=470150 RepID=UPI0015BB1512|nr:SDR family oxidoreductase [Pseudomonas taiwanensis]NWL75598.1 NAD-dependent dehydratase [Pseudomonas taiwanensis]
MNRILLTGASGFVGHATAERLGSYESVDLRLATRGPLSSSPRSATCIRFSTLDGNTDWGAALQDVNVVVHAAARVHMMNDDAVDPLREFRKVNFEGTLNLARQAANKGVRRFIFISSIKVNGESTSTSVPFLADGAPLAADPYGISKMEAEQGLRVLAIETGMEVVIIRPTLVYGPGVKANFLNMMRWLHRGVPLPLGAINNRRSLVALDNLVDLILTCIDHPRAGNQTFLVSDDEDLSTTQLLRRMGSALGTPARLIPMPSWMLEFGATLIGKRDYYQRLCSSLQVDITKTKALLGWTPPVSVDEALYKTAKHYLDQSTK